MRVWETCDWVAGFHFGVWGRKHLVLISMVFDVIRKRSPRCCCFRSSQWFLDRFFVVNLCAAANARVLEKTCFDDEIHSMMIAFDELWIVNDLVYWHRIRNDRFNENSSDIWPMSGLDFLLNFFKRLNALWIILSLLWSVFGVLTIFGRRRIQIIWRLSFCARIKFISGPMQWWSSHDQLNAQWIYWIVILQRFFWNTIQLREQFNHDNRYGAPQKLSKWSSSDDPEEMEIKTLFLREK